MSDSTDNTTELDSYGVWVKRPGSTDEPSTDDSLDFDSVLDIPDFPETETSAEPEMDITENLPDSFDEISLDDFEDGGIEINSIEDIGEPAVEEPVAETEIPVEESFNIEEEAPVIEEVAEAEEEVSIDDFELPEEDGEISLDEFMDDGFSDESVASGNNGFAPAEEQSDGEISLDDFLDGGDFTSGPAPEVKPQEEIVDEKPLEMDISFDNSADTIETEDNVQTEETFMDDPDDFVTDDETETFVSDGASHSTEVFGDTEEIDLSDFGIDADAEETPITQDIEESKAKDKVVDFDLSVSDEKMSAAPVISEIKDEEPEVVAEEKISIVETPVSPAPSAAPAVSEGSNELLQQIINELSGMKAEINALKSNLESMQAQKEAVPAAAESEIIEETELDVTATEDTAGFFDDTDGDDTIALSGDELDNMLSSVEITESEEEPVVEETIAEEPVIEEIVETEEPVIEETEIELPESNEDSSVGFFDDTDGDDTIALSGDELDNMLSGVELSENETEVIEETIPEEEPLDDIPEEIDIEPVSTETINDDIFGSVEESDIFDSDTDTFEINEEEPSEESAEVMEEPNLDDITIEEETEEDELPEEISIPKVDDILVESANNDFMESVKDTTETEEITETIDDFDDFMNDGLDVEEDLTESNIDYLSEDAEKATEDGITLDEITDSEEVAVEDVVLDDFPSVDDTFATAEEEPVTEEPVVEDTVTEDFPSVDDSFSIEEEAPAVEEPVVEETVAEDFPSVDDSFGITEEEPVVEEPAIEEEVISEETEEPVVIEEEAPVIEETAVSEAEVTEPDTPATEEKEGNEELKQDIKSVLLYMDQLLENLPEDKIVEFAKSEEFSTYKKLFSELGLA